MSTVSQRTIGSLGYACRADVGTPETRAEARRDLAAIRLEQAIAEAMDAPAPLTMAQRAALASILTSGVK
ncbi:hypothetical protein [Micropruina sp.]|uniref:hypothetical protein n=1 Tax=Micropruina sp. TaxID=2737536 RepID=UPI0039E24297